MPGPQDATLAKQLAAIGAKNALLDDRKAVTAVVAHCKANPADAKHFNRMIANGQVAALSGKRVVPADKPLNSNFNKVAKSTVSFMKVIVLEGSAGVITPVILGRLLLKRKTVLYELYIFFTAEDPAQAIAAGTTFNQLKAHMLAKCKAVGDRAKLLIIEDDEPAWLKCGVYLSIKHQGRVHVKHVPSDLIVISLVSEAWKNGVR